jgi:retron-type reverse transcriptase
MKRCGGLYQNVCNIKNLELADKKARRGKRNQYGIKYFDKNRVANLFSLHETLKNKEYKTSPYSTFIINEGKERVVSKLPYFPDRIAHHAIMNIIKPIFLSHFTADTFSCIEGRGIMGAFRSVSKALKDKDNTKYVLKIDIRQFYPSIDHDILKQLLRRKIKDKDLLCLLDEIIDSSGGVPIGNLLSQYFANYYLSSFDHWIKEKKHVKYYCRYADDMVLFGATKDELHQLLSDIRIYLKEELKLEIKSNYQVFPVEARGIDFVGYVFRHKFILVRKGIKWGLKRAVVKRKDRSSISSYLGWLKHCNGINLRRKILHEREYLYGSKKVGRLQNRVKPSVSWRKNSNVRTVWQGNINPQIYN